MRGIDDVVCEENKLVFIGLDLTKACTLNCLYCFEKSGNTDKNELSLDEKKTLLEQAKILGANSLVVAGAGEPLLDKDFREIITYANNLSLVSVVYTNGTVIDEDMAKFLYSNNVSPIINLDSLNPEVHDYLTQVKGAHKKAMSAIELCLAAGYGKINDRTTNIAIATLYLKQNLHEVPAIINWAFERCIKPTVDVLGVHGRAISHKDQLRPALHEISGVQQSIGGESVCDAGTPCKIWMYGIFISCTGDAKYCSEISDAGIGNIRNQSRSELLKIKKEKYPAKAGSFTCSLKESAYLK